MITGVEVLECVLASLWMVSCASAHEHENERIDSRFLDRWVVRKPLSIPREKVS